MLTFPTRAKFVEIQLGSSVYGSSLMHQLNCAMISAMKVGKKKIHFKFDPASQHDSRAKGINKLFIEHLGIKKYKIKAIKEEGFILFIR